MRKKKTTSTDIAKAAGVSQSAVSMILNKKYNVSFSKETVEKVEQIAKELGYQPPKRKIRKESRREKLLVVFYQSNCFIRTFFCPVSVLLTANYQKSFLFGYKCVVFLFFMEL